MSKKLVESGKDSKSRCRRTDNQGVTVVQIRELEISEELRNILRENQQDLVIN